MNGRAASMAVARQASSVTAPSSSGHCTLTVRKSELSTYGGLAQCVTVSSFTHPPLSAPSSVSGSPFSLKSFSSTSYLLAASGATWDVGICATCYAMRDSGMNVAAENKQFLLRACVLSGHKVQLPNTLLQTLHEYSQIRIVAWGIHFGVLTNFLYFSSSPK